MIAEDWIKTTEFECNITKQPCSYNELHVAWYDSYIKEESTQYFRNFMLVKQGEGFAKLKTHVDGWSLSDLPVKNIILENLVLFFTDFLVTDSIHTKGDFKKTIVDYISWTDVFRRLTVRHYEVARHHLGRAKEFDEFRNYTELQLLQEPVLSRYVDHLNL